MTKPLLGDIPLLGELFRAGSATSGKHDSVVGVPQQELWVIAKAPSDEQLEAQLEQGTSDDVPGCGGMVCCLPVVGEDAEPKLVPMPLKHTNVDASVAGFVASVTVTQQFHNPYNEKIEASYVFPLPQNAAVSEFIMVIGDRRIRGIVREREEAERIYHQARAQGYVASLLTQERPNVFTQKIANIEPGKQIDVEVTYYNTLAYHDGWFQFVFPMVVGPRFNPSHMTDGIGAVARGQRGGSGQNTEVQYLRPNERSGHDIALTLNIDAGVVIEEVKSINHRVQVDGVKSPTVQVCLKDNDTIPNRDFVLAWRVAGHEPKAAVVMHRDERGGFFSLMVYPPEVIQTQRRSPIEMVFVLDCSGSMSGEPLALAKRAVQRALTQMEPDDTFQIIRFSERASSLGPKPIVASEANIQRGLAYLASLTSGGGTLMINGIRAALDFPHDERRTRYVTFLTDGYIGNETEILGEVQKHVGSARIFSFGIGSSTNRYLMERMAKLGRGVVAFIGPREDPEPIVDLFVERISHPAMMDVEIDWAGMRARDVTPQRLPDVFAGRPLMLTGRFDGDGVTTVNIHGHVAGEEIVLPITVNLDDVDTQHSAMANVWARMQIAQLADHMVFDGEAGLADRVRELALEYGIMSAYTAFVAVDSSHITEGEHGTEVQVAVPVPEGVRYETTVESHSGG
ncbi:MAG: VWA domain-containing protein [Phycisphaerales bacterium]|nr:VWA domain-containing protein [Phycisphaerales bacterium]